MDLANYLRSYQVPRSAKGEWSDERLALLGTMPDARVADGGGPVLGRTPDEVRIERVRRWIARYQ